MTCVRLIYFIILGYSSQAALFSDVRGKVCCIEGWTRGEKKERKKSDLKEILCVTFLSFFLVRFRSGMSMKSASYSSISSAQSLDHAVGSSARHEGQFSRYPRHVFSARGLCAQFWHGKGCPLFGVVHSTCSLPTTTSRTFQSALKDR